MSQSSDLILYKCWPCETHDYCQECKDALAEQKRIKDEFFEKINRDYDKITGQKRFNFEED